MFVTIIAALSAVEGVDPITAIFQRDWAALGGWSLFISLAIIIILGYMREVIVPGARYRRLEASAQEQSATLATTVKALEKSVTANQILEHFFRETVPKRGESDHEVS